MLHSRIAFTGAINQADMVDVNLAVPEGIWLTRNS
jgi:hypothetical protein